MEFNIRLYDLMKETENKIWVEKGNLKFGIILYHYEIKDFMDCLSPYDFGDEGIICYMKDGYLFVEMQEIFLNNNYQIKNYINCFENDDYKYLFEEIKKFDEEGI